LKRTGRAVLRFLVRYTSFSVRRERALSRAVNTARMLFGLMSCVRNLDGEDRMVGLGGDQFPQRKSALAGQQPLAARFENDFIIGLGALCARVA
jgi:hypothetical protein